MNYCREAVLKGRLKFRYVAIFMAFFIAGLKIYEYYHPYNSGKIVKVIDKL